MKFVFQCIRSLVDQSVSPALLSSRLGLPNDGIGYFRCQVTLAQLKERAAPSTPTGTSSSFSASSGFRSATARLLGTGNGNRALSFVGGNGGGKTVSTSSRISGSFAASSSSTSMTNTNFDGKGTYLVFNVGDAIFVCDLNSQDKVNYGCSLFFFERFNSNALVFGM